MTDLKILGRCTRNWLGADHPMPDDFRFSLGAFDPFEYSYLLQQGFENPQLLWKPRDDIAGAPIVRHASGRVVAACTIIQPCFLHQVVVDPEFQKLGVGAAFIRNIAAIFELPYLLVQVDDTTTEHGWRFWTKQQFKELGT
jgi:GNAT superfamily N-acetyltransferase